MRTENFNAMAGHDTRTHLSNGRGGWACGTQRLNTRNLTPSEVRTRAELERLPTTGHLSACLSCLASKGKSEARKAASKLSRAEREAKELARDIKRDGPCSAGCGRAASFYSAAQLCTTCSCERRLPLSPKV